MSHCSPFAASFAQGGVVAEALEVMARSESSEVNSWGGASVCGMLGANQSRTQSQKAAAEVEARLLKHMGRAFDKHPSEAIAEALLLQLEVRGRKEGALTAVLSTGVFLRALLMLCRPSRPGDGPGAAVWWGGIGAKAIGRHRILQAVTEVEDRAADKPDAGEVMLLLCELCGNGSAIETWEAAGNLLAITIARGVVAMPTEGWACCLRLLDFTRMSQPTESFLEEARKAAQLAAQLAKAAVKTGTTLGEDGLRVLLRLCQWGQAEEDCKEAMMVRSTGLALACRSMEHIGQDEAASRNLLELVVEGMEMGALPETKDAQDIAQKLLWYRRIQGLPSLPGTEGQLVRLTFMGQTPEAIVALVDLVESSSEACSSLIEAHGLRWVVGAAETTATGPDVARRLIQAATREDHQLLHVLQTSCVRDLVEICEAEACQCGAGEVAMSVLLRMAQDDEMVRLLYAQAEEAGVAALAGLSAAADLFAALEDGHHIKGKPRLSRVYRGRGIEVAGMSARFGSPLDLSRWGSARATHAVPHGCWAFEATVTSLPPGAHIRVGWGTEETDMSDAAGRGVSSVGYQEAGGRIFHDGVGWPFGEPFEEGDVIGCLLIKTQLDESDPASIHFFRNGVHQGDAGSVCNGEESVVGLDSSQPHFPIVSLYGNAVAELSFGPTLRYPLSSYPMSSQPLRGVWELGGGVIKPAPITVATVVQDVVERSFQQALAAACVEVLAKNLSQDAIKQAIEAAVEPRVEAEEAVPELPVQGEEGGYQAGDELPGTHATPIKAAPARRDAVHQVEPPTAKSTEEDSLRAAIPLCDEFLAEEINELVDDLAADVLMAAYEMAEEDEEKAAAVSCPGSPLSPLSPLPNVGGARVNRQPGSPTLSRQSFEIYSNQDLLVGKGL